MWLQYFIRQNFGHDIVRHSLLIKYVILYPYDKHTVCRKFSKDGCQGLSGLGDAYSNEGGN